MVIISQVRRRKLKEIVTYMRQYRIFEQVEPNVIEKIWKHLEVKNFIRNQVVYHEKTDATDGVYFISEGEFEISQKINTNPANVVDRAARKALLKAKEAAPEDVNRMTNQRSRGIRMLEKLEGQTQSYVKETKAQETSHKILVLGKGEFFGLDEIFKGQPIRQ